MLRNVDLKVIGTTSEFLNRREMVKSLLLPISLEAEEMDCRQ